MPKPINDPAILGSGLMPYLERFVEWSDMRGYATSTVDTRRRAGTRFIGWCVERGIDRPQDLTQPILERYQRHLFYYRKGDGQPLSFGSQHSLLAPLKAWFKYLAKQRYILFNPAADLELPRQGRRLPKHILSPQEIDAVLRECAKHGEIGIRDRAIIETLYATGIRRMELVQLHVQDLDQLSGTLRINEGKGGKDRVVPLGRGALNWLRKYLDQVRPTLVVEPDPGWLFLTDFGDAMTKNRLGERIRRLLDAAGIDKPGACHLFRHAMATHMLQNGADIRYIQLMLGHANLTTTEIYTQVSIDQLKAIHAATHPTARGDD